LISAIAIDYFIDCHYAIIFIIAFIIVSTPFSPLPLPDYFFILITLSDYIATISHAATHAIISPLLPLLRHFIDDYAITPFHFDIDIRHFRYYY
jgi:hypothetical protein